jgi:3-hydroxy-9,10-secoandrosta-1,3,5(10)-triene-9,17-dione monooxygenase reductase component
VPDEPGGHIHYENPFVTPAELREPARQLRGRFARGVTVWTAGGSESRTALTMSSVLIDEGEPPVVLGLINDTTDLYETVTSTRRFVMHLLRAEHHILSDRFAGHRPAPGGMFSDLEVEDTEWGPVISLFEERAFCRLVDEIDTGFHKLLHAHIDKIEPAELDDPLIYFRGKYRKLEP